MIGATLLMVVVVPPLFCFMPDLIRIVFYPAERRADATRRDAARGSS